MSRCEAVIRNILAAVAYANMNCTETLDTPDLSQHAFPTKEIENGLKAAYHFQQLQDRTRNEVLQACVTVMWLLVNRVHAMLEAIVSIRARYRHFQFLSQAPTSDRDKLLQAYQQLIDLIGTGAIAGKILGPLVAFLVSGVKGLLAFPRDAAKYGPVKVSHFLVVVDELNQNQLIKEDIYIHTQSYLLDVIEGALFPDGIEKSHASLSEPVNNDSWKPKSCSIMLLARALQMDLANFCSNRSQFPDGDSYPDPPFELPHCPTATTQKTNLPQPKNPKKPTAKPMK